jgi:hypothetical protein
MVNGCEFANLLVELYFGLVDTRLAFVINLEATKWLFTPMVPVNDACGALALLIGPNS